ncbi:MAG: NACHT domain-containing protein [Rhizonema sp. PD38]|nr:NACHT domain-containing protein [Rhizonema sp. PD38]
MSTPHGGSSLANPITRLIILPIGVNVAELQRNLSELRHLNQWFQDNVLKLKIGIEVYYEEKSIFNILVVDRDSADPNIPGVRPTGVSEDHNSIAKPKSRKALVYAGTKDFIESLLSEGSEEQSIDINQLVQSCRKKAEPDIKERCGTMRVLDMTQAIGLDSIYTTVNILEQITTKTRLTIDELLQGDNLEEFDHSKFSRLAQKRVAGLDAVKKYHKLVVLGKPGAGKTTFLKYLAMQCIEGSFHNERFPIFITLKNFAEAREKPNMLQHITQRLSDYDLTDADVKAKRLLKQGKVLVLLDGLDEVREEDTKRVLDQVQEFSYLFPKNQFIITCRIAAKEYTFQGFTEVEVADFNP